MSEVERSGVTVIPVSPSSTSSSTSPGGMGHLSRYAGVAMVMIGVLCILANVVDLSLGSTLSYKASNGQTYRLYYATYSVSGHGLWTGITYIATGLTGVLTARRKTRFMITAFLMLSLVSCVLALVQFIICVSAVVRFQGRFYVSVASTGCDHCSKLTAVYVMEILLALFAVLVVVIATYSAMLSCRKLCSASTEAASDGQATFTSATHEQTNNNSSSNPGVGDNVNDAVNKGFGYNRVRDPPTQMGRGSESANGDPPSQITAISGVANPVYFSAEQELQPQIDNPHVIAPGTAAVEM